MSYLSLPRIKQHLNIENDVFNEDAYLHHLADVAQEAVEKHINQPLKGLEDSNGDIPKPLEHAMLLYIGDLYQSRESNVYGVAVNRVPFAYEYLCALYKNYGGEIGGEQ